MTDVWSPSYVFSFLSSNQKDFERDIDGDNDEEVDTVLPNLMDLNFFFEQAAIGLSKEETFKVLLSLKTLVDSKPLQTVRFWGKAADFILSLNVLFKNWQLAKNNWSYLCNPNDKSTSIILFFV